MQKNYETFEGRRNIMAYGNDELLAKAAFITDYLTSGGLSLAEQDRFIDMVIEASVIGPQCRTEKMGTPKKLIEKLGFNSRIMQAATEATNPTSTTVPDLGKVELSVVEVIAAVDLGYSTLEDNIDGASLKDRLMKMMATAAARDLEELFLQGNTNSGDSYLALLNGWLRQATSNTVNTSTASLCSAVLSSMLDSLPDKYFGNASEYRFFCNPKFDRSYRIELSNRWTGAGDKYLLEAVPVVWEGVPVIKVPKMPAGGLLLVHPQNLIEGFHRNISIEAMAQPRKRVVELTLTARVDAKVEEEAAMVVTTTCLSSLG